MPTMFTARVAGVDDGECLVAGVAEREDGAGQELLFQAALEPPDEQDVELGLDTYCVSVAGQRSAYGCVEELSIEGDRLRTVIREEAVGELGLPDRVIEVRLAVGGRDIKLLREGLRRILASGRPAARPEVLRL